MPLVWLCRICLRVFCLYHGVSISALSHPNHHGWGHRSHNLLLYLPVYRTFAERYAVWGDCVDDEKIRHLCQITHLRRLLMRLDISIIRGRLITCRHNNSKRLRQSLGSTDGCNTVITGYWFILKMASIRNQYKDWRVLWVHCATNIYGIHYMTLKCTLGNEMQCQCPFKCNVFRPKQSVASNGLNMLSYQGAQIWNVIHTLLNIIYTYCKLV